MKRGIKYFILWFFIFCFSNAFSQKKEDLVRKKEENQRDIEFTSKIIKETGENKKITYDKLLILNKRIEIRTQLIDNLNTQISQQNKRIFESNGIIGSLQSDLNKLKGEYAQFIYYSYRLRNRKNIMLYVFASKDINQAYKRIKYLQQYTAYRKKQVELILTFQGELMRKVEDYKQILVDNTKTLQEREHETKLIEGEKIVQQKAMVDLTKREKELKAKLDEKNRIVAKLQGEIERIIEDERKKALASRVNANSNKAKNKTVISNTSTSAKSNLYNNLTPEDRILSNNFKDNMGHLPWPTKTGVVTGIFGEHPHPVLKGIKVRNNGIDISTVKGEEIRALFEGEVTKVFAILGANYTVIIRHGNYLTVYQNMIDVCVKAGQKVKMKQVIGKVYGDGDNAVVHLEIWEELKNLDPIVWLAKKGS
jgi:murein hydrolase activator